MSIQSSTATMNEEGEKTCPLCTEEMDLTDQHLKPCKCGYDICVWCWHHIMDMAEKDKTEGRCPACRNPYNKEKIVGMGLNCERLVSEMNVEKRLKSQKGKSKTSEGRKQLGSVRVIQRDLVYVVGLPLTLADEDLLQRREYFGQYGKVLKVSLSRTAAGAIQQFANSTCSVYITFTSEEEAVRCIQTVHGFVLDGQSLRACFGTTKYCHAWLRNVSCSNPDCLYLHEIGSQVDSFTKDEIISAYTRSRVKQIAGATNCMRRCSGNVLPPPTDEYCNNSSATSGMPKTTTAVDTTNSPSVRFSPPNSSSSRSAALPAGASWGACASNNHPSSTSTCFSGQLKQKPDTCNGPVAFSTAVAGPSQVSSMNSDTGNKLVSIEECTMLQDRSNLESLDPVRKKSNTDDTVIVCDRSSASAHSTSLPRSRAPPNTSNMVDWPVKCEPPAIDEDSFNATDGNMVNVCSDILSLSIHDRQHVQRGYVDNIGEPLNSQASGEAAEMSDEVCGLNVQSDFRLGMPTLITQVDLHEIQDGLLSFDDERFKDPVVASTNRSHRQDISHSFHLLRHSNIHSPQFNNADGLISVDLDRQVVNRKNNIIVSASNSSCGCPENILNSLEVIDVECSNFFPIKNKTSLLGRYEAKVAIGAGDMGESSIISNILSMGCDSWAESLTSPQNLAMLFAETDKCKGSFAVPGSWKIQNSNQSRFSFAREEEPVSQVSDVEPSIGYFEEAFKQRPFGNDFSNSDSLYLEKFATCKGFPVLNGTESDSFASNHSHISSSELSVMKSQISAPPGFSMPTREPPPCFTSNDRTEQNLDAIGNSILDASFLLRNQYQTVPIANTVGNADIEFMDPAILEVGRGTFPGGINGPGLDLRSSFSQLSANEARRYQSSSQKPLPPHQNQRFVNLGDICSPFGDVYGIPSRVLEQTVATPFSQYPSQTRNAIFSKGQWEGWNETQCGILDMTGLLRNKRLGFNKLYSGYEDTKIQTPSSGNLYIGT